MFAEILSLTNTGLILFGGDLLHRVRQLEGRVGIAAVEVAPRAAIVGDDPVAQAR